ncbi:hypothetical protein AOQ84DRAFT_386496 [Glonium stellatum]|uniref:Uncharacterized protein n=1 Tax=Glonium stellatum TaxID=574774 RepID=A0A8E2JWN0_9PEZI|nr:hypothetical protein AOQ84DRAFT_386496 [Glonium stellatum]
MSLILAVTKLVFFENYHDFRVDPEASLFEEFHRLARKRQWKQGANSKLFEKSWCQCFGDDIPVGLNIDELVNNTESLDDDEALLVSKLQNLRIDKKRKSKIKKSAVAPQFTFHYGEDASNFEKWQQLCLDCGIKLVPDSIKQCKLELRRLSINIYDFLNAKREEQVPYKFPSKKALVKDLQRPGRKYPLELAKGNKFLRILLVECW